MLINWRENFGEPAGSSKATSPGKQTTLIKQILEQKTIEFSMSDINVRKALRKTLQSG